MWNNKWVWLKISPFLVVWGQHQQKTLQSIVKTKASHLQNVIGYDLMENWIIWRPCFHLSKTFCQNWTEIPFSDWQWLFWGPKLSSKVDYKLNILFLILIFTPLYIVTAKSFLPLWILTFALHYLVDYKHKKFNSKGNSLWRSEGLL